jgi:hypothetical protein
MNNKRHPVCMIHVGIPLEDVSEWDSQERIIESMKEAVQKISYPSDARVQAWFAFLPDPSSESKVLEIQDGFYQDPNKSE